MFSQEPVRGSANSLLPQSDPNPVSGSARSGVAAVLAGRQSASYAPLTSASGPQDISRSLCAITAYSNDNDAVPGLGQAKLLPLARRNSQTAEHRPSPLVLQDATSRAEKSSYSTFRCRGLVVVEGLSRVAEIGLDLPKDLFATSRVDDSIPLTFSRTNAAGRVIGENLQVLAVQEVPPIRFELVLPAPVSSATGRLASRPDTAAHLSVRRHPCRGPFRALRPPGARTCAWSSAPSSACQVFPFGLPPFARIRGPEVERSGCLHAHSRSTQVVHSPSRTVGRTSEAAVSRVPIPSISMDMAIRNRFPSRALNPSPRPPGPAKRSTTGTRDPDAPGGPVLRGVRAASLHRAGSRHSGPRIPPSSSRPNRCPGVSRGSLCPC